MRSYLLKHTVETAYEKEWGNLKNGHLLTLTEAEGFDALITTDQSIRYQQNLSDRRSGVIVLLTTNRPRIMNNVAQVVQVVDKLHPSSYEEIDFP